MPSIAPEEQHEMQEARCVVYTLQNPDEKEPEGPAPSTNGQSDMDIHQNCNEATATSAGTSTEPSTPRTSEVRLAMPESDSDLSPPSPLPAGLPPHLSLYQRQSDWLARRIIEANEVIGYLSDNCEATQHNDNTRRERILQAHYLKGVLSEMSSQLHHNLCTLPAPGSKEEWNPVHFCLSRTVCEACGCVGQLGHLLDLCSARDSRSGFVML